MKNLLSLIIGFLFLHPLLAQVPQSLNYQAVARNQQGNVLANKAVSIQITILNGSNPLYSETHAVTTNQFGLFTLQVGKGNINSGSFAGIDWSTGSHLMKIGMDPDRSGTYLDMGTSPLLTVPYAMVAAKALNVVDQSLSGLKDVDTAGKVQGYVLGWDGTKWKPLSGVAQQGWLMNNGDLSNVNPTGKIGLGVSAPKAKLHVEGSDKEKIMAFKGDKFISNRSTGSDYGVTTSGEGLYLTSETGNYKQAYYFTQGNPLDTTPIFGITSKTGTSAWSPALNVSQQGMVGIGVAKPKTKLHVQDGGLLLQGSTGTVDFKDAGTVMMWIPAKSAFRAGKSTDKSWDKDSIGVGSTAFGLGAKASGEYAVAMGNITQASGRLSTATGERTKATGELSMAMGFYALSSAKYAIAMGTFSKALADGSMALGSGTASGNYSIAVGSGTASGNNSLALGSGTKASGVYSIAMGLQSEASGNSSTAMGMETIASGSSSTAMGMETEAYGRSSIATGEFSIAYGSGSAALGRGCIARAFSSTVVGSYNDTSEVVDHFINNASEDRIFQIGVGTGGTRKNAMTVLFNGNVGIGVLEPQKNLSIARGMNIDQLNTNTGTLNNSLTFGSTGTEGIASRRSSGSGQYGLDFYTNNTKRLSISNSGTITVSDILLVKSNKGIVRSADATQQKIIKTNTAINQTITAGQTIIIPITWSESFGAPPVAYVGNASGGGFAEVIMSIANVSATGASLYIYNGRNSAYSVNYNVNIIAIGAE